MICIICYEKESDNGNVNLKCGHEYCLNCFIKHMRLDNKCAMCRYKLAEDVEKANISRTPYAQEKIIETIDELYDNENITEDKHVELCNFALTLIDNL